MSIGVLDLHLVCPMVVGWRAPDLGFFVAIVLEERFNVIDADPDTRL
jgi:hypothetical protein